MDPKLEKILEQLTQAFSLDQGITAFALLLYLPLGGAMALYIRFLYRRYGATANSAESITRVFPMLTMVTIAVIAVVKSSMALSLGLVGALSIVRFRSAIKEPEELVYLFLCIAIGLSLGAGQPLLAFAELLVVSVFAITMHKNVHSVQGQNLLLTVSGDAEKYFNQRESSALVAIGRAVHSFELQRLDVEKDRGSIRVVIHNTRKDEAANWLQQLRNELPDCELSYVNLDSTL